ncbi:MAG: EF-P lysine aminoacylase EpmA [Kiritimatiellae bacterium]|nr:EF-P lysine aminoacylase EpmA [Kiritimatiellia bacterium]
MRPHPADSDALRAMGRMLAKRAQLYDAIRRFFRERGFLEVETPVRLPANAPETNIDAIPAGTGWLRTSPELAMKRLLAAGHEKLVQLAPCFREGENGRWHHPEFMLLEWYRAHAGYIEILADTKALLATLAQELCGTTDITWQGAPLSLAQELWEKRTVSDAFIEHAGWDPAQHFDPDRFDLDLVTRVEPALATDHPVILIDYPAPLAALARRKPNDPTRAERWELYLGGVEIANAYSELTDPTEQRARFEQANALRQKRGAQPYPLDESFMTSLEHLPPSGGIALGVDRLLMILAGANSLDGVLPFRHG